MYRERIVAGVLSMQVSASLMSLAVDSRRFEFPRDGGLEKVDMEHGASSGN